MRDLNQALERIESRLNKIYPNVLPNVIDSIEELIKSFSVKLDEGKNQFQPDKKNWDHTDIVLITYADQVAETDSPKTPTLATLRRFLNRYSVPEFINTVHLLPFYPFTSDDGFSVVDYCDLADGTGDWNDVKRLNEDVYLMFDLVLNHCSKQSEWFQRFLECEPPYDQFFHAVDPDEDLSLVTRPRSLPLLTKFDTSNGPKHVWTTFSDDQVDLNFGNPIVLLEFLKILLFYVQHGARIVRLDAIAFLWKEIGTTCVHLEQTHEVVKLMRDVLEIAAPGVILLTETNVPHKENVSYFGDGDEAQMVYQFSLPPLLLDAFTHQDPTPLRNWLENLEPIPDGTTFFNFASSHDGIGVRPLEGLLEPERFNSLVDEMRKRGAFIGTRKQPDGSDTAYELNITYIDALSEPYDSTDESWVRSDTDIRKFISSQAIMLSLPGIPGIYFHSLVGTPNDCASAVESGIPRRINRRKYDLNEVCQILDDQESSQAKVFAAYQNLLRCRIECSAFHPDAECKVIDLGDSHLFGYQRKSVDESETVIVVANPTATKIEFSLDGSQRYQDVLTKTDVASRSVISPFDFLWLRVV